MTPQDRLRQARVKMRMIAAREMRRYVAGDLDYLPGNHDQRAVLDAIAHAYAAGVRSGQRGGDA